VRLPSPGRATGLTGAAFGLVGVGAAAGLAAERYAIGRTRLRPDPDAREPFFALRADRTRTVTTEDGVSLHVEEVGSQRAPLTVVLVHGYTHEMAAWHFQRKAFAADNPGRIVLYDQRAHGRSSRGPAENATIDQLGRDLGTVLDTVAPTGDILLVGHSMGGMTIMALADSRPELFGDRVVGVALLSTSTGKLADVTFGLPAAVGPVTKTVLPWLTRTARRRPGAFERGRRVGTDLAFLLTRYGAFGDREVSPSLVEFTERMIERTPVEVLVEFYDTFVTHDKLKAIEVLRRVEVLILVGSKDLVTPPDHSRAMAEFLPEASLVVVEGAGHMVLLERAALVTLQLRAWIARTTRAAPARSA